MTKRGIKNTAASVRQRLLNMARQTGRPFNEVLQYFAMERFLYRLSKSPHSRMFILKGALMFKVWKAPLSRPTMDIDLLARTDSSVDAIVAVLKEICLQDVEEDGVVFDATSVEGERITEAAEYRGVRVRLRGSLGTARITVQIDIGFGDVVVPAAASTEYPTLLDLPAPRVRGYSKESAVAEKFEAMVKLGILNSRMKDFFDVWLMSRQFDFSGRTLARAIMKTFSARGTEISSQPIALTSTFAAEPAKAAQWRGFIRRNRLEHAPEQLGGVIVAVAAFLGPIASALPAGMSFEVTWNAPGPWV